MVEFDRIYLSVSSGLAAILIGVSWIFTEDLGTALIILLLIPQFFMQVWSTFYKDRVKGPIFKLVKSSYTEYEENPIGPSSGRTSITYQVDIMNIGDVAQELNFTSLEFEIDDREVSQEETRPLMLQPQEVVSWPFNMKVDKPYPAITHGFKAWIKGYYFDAKGKQKEFEGFTDFIDKNDTDKQSG